MIALLFIVLSFVFGISLLRRISLRLNVFELASAGFVLGSLLSIWITFCLSILLGLTTATLVTLVGMGIVTFLLTRSHKQPILSLRFSLRGILTYLLFTFFWIVILLPLFITHMLQIKPDGWYSGGGAWGDIALHATFIEKFAGNNTLDLTSPIYAQEQTHYPFLFDFYGGLLMRFGLSLQEALVISGFFFIFAFLQLLYFFTLRLFKSHGASLIATILFLFNGGIGIRYAVRDFLAQNDSLLNFLLHMKVEYAHLAVFGLHWSNLIADYILPQRAFLTGLPVFVLILFLLRSLWLAKENHPDQRLLLALLLGMLPLFHTHTFLAAGGLVIFFIAADLLLHRTNPKVWLLPVSLVILLTTPQLWWQFSQTVGHPFMRLQWGWMKESDENIVIFWLRNMGLEFILFVLGGIYLLVFERKERFLKLVFIPLSILFFITNIIVFQPHDYDNMKLMIYTHLAIVLVSTYLLLKLFQKNSLGRLLAAVLFIGLTITGILSVWRESYTSWQIVDLSDLEMAQVIKDKTEATAIFLTSDSHRHPVSMLAGRSLVMGYRGWLWTHGIDYSQTEKDVKTMFTGQANAQLLLGQYHVAYVFIGPSETADFSANLNYYKTNFPTAFENASGIVFDVRGSPTPPVAKQ